MHTNARCLIEDEYAFSNVVIYKDACVCDDICIRDKAQTHYVLLISSILRIYGIIQIYNYAKIFESSNIYVKLLVCSYTVTFRKASVKFVVSLALVCNHLCSCILCK